MKFPDDQIKQQQLSQTVSLALDQETQNYVHKRKTIKKKIIIKKLGLTKKQISAVENNDTQKLKLKLNYSNKTKSE